MNSYYTDNSAQPISMQITYSPPLSDPVRCVNVSFGDDNLVDSDETFVVIFYPLNTEDMFVDGNNEANVTIIDDEGMCNNSVFCGVNPQ